MDNNTYSNRINSSSIGTSLPEMFITITSSIDEHSDLIIGNAIGSCICNFLLVIGIESLIKLVKLDKRIVKRHLPIGIATMLLLIYIIYTIYEKKKEKNEKIDEEIIKDVESKEMNSIFMIICYMILGILGLKFGSDFVVDNSILVAQNLGLFERFIGMTIIAAGTALPEIITGIIAAKRDKTDLLLGNISGSNILNLYLLVGLGAIINHLTFDTNFNNNNCIFTIDSNYK